MGDFRIRVRYPDGKEVEVEGDRAFVEAKFQELVAAMPAQREVRHPTSTATLAAPIGDSLAEFVLQKRPQTDVDRTLVIACWLKANGVDGFTTEEITKAYRNAGEAVPPDVSSTIAKNVRKKFIEPLPEPKDGKKAWRIIRPGVEYVESLPSA